MSQITQILFMEASRGAIKRVDNNSTNRLPASLARPTGCLPSPTATDPK